MLGIQLYTIRDKMSDRESIRSALLKIKEIGYECVQLAGALDNMIIIAEECSKINLNVMGILTNIDLCEQNEDKLFEIAKTCNAKDIGISSSIFTDDDAYDLISRANAFAKKAKANGLSFSYHNHSNEFIRGNCGKTLMQLLIEGFDEKLVDFMPDTYWLQFGGIDVRAFIEKLSGRIKILHLKDMKRTAEGITYAEIGSGNINFNGIIEVSKKADIEYYIVEQDKCDVDSLLSAQTSYNYITKNLF